MKTVYILNNPLLPESYESFCTHDVLDFITKKFEKWPSSARLYHNSISDDKDVTPFDEDSVDKLNKLNGTFFVVIYPKSPVQIAIAVIAVIAITAIAFIQPPTPTTRNIQSQSSNNELSSRTNKARLNARIPDIYGSVISTPDLMAQPYTLFVDNSEVEYAYMCIGKGYYDINAIDVKDDTTRIIDIPGSRIEIYPPFTSPNSNTEPQLRIGDPINTNIKDVKRLTSVNGQVLRPPNVNRIVGGNNIRFISPNIIETSSDDFDFTDKFAQGDTINISNAMMLIKLESESRNIYASSEGYIQFSISDSTLPERYSPGLHVQLTGAFFSTYDEGYITSSYDLSGEYVIESVSLVTNIVEGESTYFCKISLQNPSAINPKWSIADVSLITDSIITVSKESTAYDLSGQYIIVSVSSDTITLSNPSSINSDWGIITITDYLSPTLSTSSDKWVGPFVIDSSSTDSIISNFTASNGLYKDDGKNQYRVDVVCELEIKRILPNGTLSDVGEIFQVTLEGSATYRNSRSASLICALSETGKCSVRARRVTATDISFNGSVVDEIKWRDLYGSSEVQNNDFGDITTVYAVTYATAGALSIKERKLNMRVTRKLPKRISGHIFTTELYPTKNAADIISAICLDAYIGNRKAYEIDFDSIYNTMIEVIDYFGDDKFSEFSYTFDSSNLSFEEIITSIAESVFCVAYRRGSVIKLSFDKGSAIPSLLFNHRNKIPGSESRTVTFGNKDGYDGIVLKYINYEDGSQVTYELPYDGTAVNPKEIETIGVVNKLQAHVHAWRIWNKIQFQNISVEFTATQEADLLIIKDKILLADNTRTNINDGEIVGQNGFELVLSRDIDFNGTLEYVIFLQMPDGTVDAIPVSAHNSKRKVVLSRAPKCELSVSENNFARTTFLVTGSSDVGASKFVIESKVNNNKFTPTLTCINYDERYYSKDKDYLNQFIDINGDLLI